MSVIAAKVYNSRIEIAADSIVCRGWSKNTTGNFTKLNQDNGMIVGATGECQETSLLWHFMRTHKPDGHNTKDILAFIIEFSQWKGTVIGNGNVNNSYLLAFEGHLFEIENLFVHEIKNYCAVGAGEDYANAALYLGHSPREAVKTACELCCYVAEPIVQYEMERS